MTPRRTIISMLALLATVVGLTPCSAHAFELFVSDPGANAVLEYDSETRAFRGVFASGGGLTEPSGLTFGPDGNLYVGSPGFTTTQPDMILRYNGTTGAFIDVFATGGPLNFPQYLAFAPSVAAAVPEPGALTLLAVGLVLACRRWERPRKVRRAPRGPRPIGV